MQQPLIVQAEYSFKGGNNDELCFKKGDLITVTQREEGGWWEGTLNDKTGWFPSNYVNEYKAPLPISEIIRPPEEIQEYRSVVLKDLLDSERAHVAEIQGLLENFLEPLQTSQILTPDEYAQLMCNFVEVVKTHDELLSNIEDCNDRVGKLFITKAPHIKQVHQAYCAAHPRAIVILDKYKDELEKYMEHQGASSPGLLVLTTGLSKPFRRLDKYSAMLQELERHMESSHPDRGDTQRSVAVYKDIAATCSATRRQKELELQVLTGPVRGWQGQELSSLGDIIHMGSVAVGPDHRDRYFVLFPQTLLILSVSQRMSAFIYEGKLPLTGIVVNRLEDTECFKNAFEISGPLIERIVAVCQGPNEANKWYELLTTSNPSLPIGIKRQLSNSSMNVPQPPPHMSPPANLGTNSHQNPRNTSSVHQQSQHKRSLSFNHHLSYNQYHTPHQPHHLHQQPQQNQQNHLAAPSRKSNLVQTSNSISKITTNMVTTAAGPIATTSMAANQALSGRSGSTKANWSITNLRPAPPLRPFLFNQSTSGSGGGSSNALSSYCSGSKNQPNFEEDALVLRVIEAYCAAYQSNARNTIHSALQPWTPCLPIRGGKLKTSKPFSTSNPQLPFICNSQFASGGGGGGGGGGFGIGGYSSAQNQHRQNSVSSLNSSYIWREANPNNFNMYSTSVSSLNTAYRYSLSGVCYSGSHHSPSSIECRALSEERATRKTLNRFKTGSGCDNLFMTPLLPRKNKQAKIVKNSYQAHQRTPPPLSRNHSADESPDRYPLTGLYDRRLNRSFETASKGFQNNTTLKATTLRRSTPHLAVGDDSEDDARQQHGYGCVGGRAGAIVGGLENEDMTPTLRQLWTAIKQMQQDMSQMKLQMNEERALRGGLQQLLMSHLESAGGGGSNSKC